MSIIHEALKKSGQPITAQSKKDSFRPELLKKGGRINWGPLFVVGILILVTAPILAPVFHSGNSNPVSVEATPGIAGNMKAQFGVEEIPVAPAVRPAAIAAPIPTPAPAPAAPKFSLTGLIYSDGGSYCLINGRVVKVGETVGGATLAQVTPNQAVLDYRGEKIVLLAEA